MLWLQVGMHRDRSLYDFEQVKLSLYFSFLVYKIYRMITTGSDFES